MCGDTPHIGSSLKLLLHEKNRKTDLPYSIDSSCPLLPPTGLELWKISTFHNYLGPIFYTPFNLLLHTRFYNLFKSWLYNEYLMSDNQNSREKKKWLMSNRIFSFLFTILHRLVQILHYWNTKKIENILSFHTNLKSEDWWQHPYKDFKLIIFDI